MSDLVSLPDALRFIERSTPLYIDLAHTVRKRTCAGEFSFFCVVCNGVRRALPSDDWNLRNSLVCEECGHGSRQRHAFQVIQDVVSLQAAVKQHLPTRLIFEEVTAFKSLLDFTFGNFRGSEYLGPDKIGGQVYSSTGRNIVHEDLCNLSHESNSVDLMVSMDVLEHVPDLSKALQECFRVLKPGGIKVMTVPFYNQRRSIQRAEVRDGQIIHLLPQEFHGNPMSADGSLVFSEPGIDLIDSIDECGFSTQISIGANLERGYFPDGNPYIEAHTWNLVFVLGKPRGI